MATDIRKARADKLAADGIKKYGALSAIAGKSGIKTKYYSTGSRALDYRLGTGGLPGNAMSEVFGPPSIGKTTVLGFALLRSVQAKGGLTAMIATEPDVEEEWLERHGVNPDYNVIFRPDTGEEAFAIMKDLVYDKAVDYILYDSLGGTSSEKEQKSDVPQAFGNAALNSWGIRNVATRCWKNEVGILFINQIRDVTNSRLPAVKPPGGHTVEHFMKIIIQLKPGKEKYDAKIDGEDVRIGQELVAVMKKNKAAEGLGKTAKFDFYHIETDEAPFGVDIVMDVLNTAMTIGVVKGSGWLNHPVFEGGKINGKPKAAEFLRNNPKAIEAIDKDILAVMEKKEAEAKAKARDRRLKKAS